ncbi:MAG: hypothetical protein ACLRNQ_14365 [Flavonifractor plautii]
MIEAALRLGLEEPLESERFEQYQREVATNTYSFDRVFARGLRLESQFEMLMEILDEGIVGVNERGRSLPATASWRRSPASPAARLCTAPLGAVYPFLPFARRLKEKAPQPARVVSAGGVNINVAVAPVLRGTPASAPSPRCGGSTMRRTGRTSCAASFSTRATGPSIPLTTWWDSLPPCCGASPY